MDAEEQLKALRKSLSDAREQFKRLVKSAEDMAKHDALDAVCGRPDERANNEASAKKWNHRAEVLQEALKLLPD